MLKAYTRQKVLSWGLSVFPLTEKGSPQTEVHPITSALLLSSLRYRFAIAFSGSLSDSFSPAPRVHFSRQANKS